MKRSYMTPILVLAPSMPSAADAGGSPAPPGGAMRAPRASGGGCDWLSSGAALTVQEGWGRRPFGVLSGGPHAR